MHLDMSSPRTFSIFDDFGKEKHIKETVKKYISIAFNFLMKPSDNILTNCVVMLIYM